MQIFWPSTAPHLQVGSVILKSQLLEFGIQNAVKLLEMDITQFNEAAENADMWEDIDWGFVLDCKFGLQMVSSGTSEANEDLI